MSVSYLFITSNKLAKDRAKLQKLCTGEINLGIFLKTKDIIAGWRIEVFVK